MIIFYFNQLFKNYVLKYFYKLSERLKCHYGDEIKIIYDNSENLSDDYFNDDKQYVILIYERSVPEFIFNKSNIKTILIWDDCHLLMTKDLEIRNTYYNFINKHDIFICTYGYLLFNNINLKTKIYSINHCFIPEFINTYIESKDKINKINVLGTINESYDLRKFIYDSYINNPNLNFFNSTYVIYNSELILNNALIDSEFYNYINKFKANFTDLGINNEYPDRKYIVSKFFEIGCQNTLLLCDDRSIDILSLIGLEENIHYISCNKDNFLDKVNYILNELSNEDYNKIIDNCINIIHKYHSINNRIEQFSTIIDNRYYKINIKNIEFYMELLNRNDNSYNISNYLVNFILDSVFEKNNNIFIDINSDLGFYSLLLTKYFNKIYSFETNVLKIMKIQNSCSKNKFNNIELMRKNISNISTDFYEDKYNICKSIKLDDFIINNNISKIDLLKLSLIDSDKNIKIFESMENSILNNKIDKILLEIRNNNKDLIKYIYNFFVKYNYILYIIEENKNIILNNENIDILNINDFINICIKNIL
jgi:hypothetical protein